MKRLLYVVTVGYVRFVFSISVLCSVWSLYAQLHVVMWGFLAVWLRVWKRFFYACNACYVICSYSRVCRVGTGSLVLLITLFLLLASASCTCHIPRLPLVCD